MKLDTEVIRCIYCGCGSLDIYSQDVTCSSCGHHFPRFKGVNFLGAYNNQDTLGLVEITSKVWLVQDPSKTRKNMEALNKKTREEFQKMYIAGDGLPVQKAATGSNEMARAARIREWAGFELLSEGFDFNGKLVLDMGAGMGSDSIRLLDRGANVVCMDYNPVSIKNGSDVVPEAQWIGGNSECLPFKSDTFDYTVANAALHHMNDLKGSVAEMYRVTKPGGHVFLISDPFVMAVSNRDEHEQIELRTFDSHPIVLNGVNEGLIPFNRYYEMIEALDDKAKLLTVKIHGDKDSKPTYWELNQKTKNYLSGKTGNISSVLSVSSTTLAEPTIDSEEIPAKLLFDTIGNPSKSTHFLLPHMPVEYFDDFPFSASSKFLLMNGWHAKQDFSGTWRKGYNRARIYLTKKGIQSLKKLIIKTGQQEGRDPVEMYVSINGDKVRQISLSGNAEQVVSIDKVAEINEKNVVELGIADSSENKGAVWSTYDPSRVFYVKPGTYNVYTLMNQLWSLFFVNSFIFFRYRVLGRLRRMWLARRGR